MKLQLIAVDKVRAAHFVAGVNDYLSRIDRVLPIETIEVPPGTGETTNGRGIGALSREAARIRKHVKSGTRLVVLHAEGRQLTSEQLSEWLQQEMSRSTERIAFVIGGAWGVAAPLLEQADLQLSLSRMTFPHEMARMILLEQIYRALCIWKGLPYHK